jgi:hypothetical protein
MNLIQIQNIASPTKQEMGKGQTPRDDKATGLQAITNLNHNLVIQTTLIVPDTDLTLDVMYMSDVAIVHNLKKNNLIRNSTTLNLQTLKGKRSQDIKTDRKTDKQTDRKTDRKTDII